MFDPQKDRVDYGKLLTPPEGFELDFAVFTTYSLDFDAFIGACISLGLSADTESALLSDPIFMLDVLHKTRDKIALFCEGGQIASPKKVIPLYALLENSVQQVLLNGKGRFNPSFHPKFQLAAFKNKQGEKQYRVIVLSRNLTFDRSWDVVFSADGRRTTEPIVKNKPVCDFLEFLKDYLPSNTFGINKKKKIRELISELNYVEFNIEGNVFEDFDFIPLGIGDYSIRNYPLFGKEKYYELLVMSPFLSNKTIKTLNDRWKETRVRPVLITRRQSLNEVKGCDNFDVYCMRSDVVDGEEKLGEGNIGQQDIHAKLYMMRENFYADAQLYLGSMNASDVATSDSDAPVRNVEFMVRLTSKRRYLNLDILKSQLFRGDEGDPGNPFEQVDACDIKEAEGDPDLDGVIKTICRSKAAARVEQSGDRYNIVLDIKCKEQPYPVTICPLLFQTAQPLGGTIIFENLALRELSRFYKIAVSSAEKTVERIIIIPTSGIPENRDDAVISSIIPDARSFYAYLSFVLGDDPVLGGMEALRILQNGDNVGKTSGVISSASLYEKMLKVAATDPDKLSGIDYVIKIVSKDGIIPDKFTELYNAFKRAVKR